MINCSRTLQVSEKDTSSIYITSSILTIPKEKTNNIPKAASGSEKNQLYDPNRESFALKMHVTPREAA